MTYSSLPVTNNLGAIRIVLIITIIVIIVPTGDLAYAENENARDFNLKTGGGSQVSLESFQGKPLIL